MAQIVAQIAAPLTQLHQKSTTSYSYLIKQNPLLSLSLTSDESQVIHPLSRPHQVYPLPGVPETDGAPRGVVSLLFVLFAIRGSCGLGIRVQVMFGWLTHTRFGAGGFDSGQSGTGRRHTATARPPLAALSSRQAVVGYFTRWIVPR